jgi:hypothetical protein
MSALGEFGEGLVMAELQNDNVLPVTGCFQCRATAARDPNETFARRKSGRSNIQIHPVSPLSCVDPAA